jgi:Holliday junction resolvasome RuvABC endonuclease subunit
MFHETPKKVREKTDKDIHDRLYHIIKGIEKIIEEKIVDAKENSFGDYLEKFQSA